MSIAVITASNAISKDTKCKGLFKDSYAFDYTLKVTERHIHTGQVLSACCLFCIYISCEHALGETRVHQATINSKDFKPPFRVELFRSHHEEQHSSIWRQYQSASNQDKFTFFDKYIAYTNTLFAKFQPAQTPFTLDIDMPIIDTIISDMFFYPDNHAGTSRANAPKLFKHNDDRLDRYKVIRENSLQF